MLKPKLSQNALRILRARYLQKDRSGKIIETAQDLFWRVACNVALAETKYLHKKKVNELKKKHHKHFWELTHLKSFRDFAKKDPHIEKTAEKFYNLLASLEFLPNSPCLFNAGRKIQQLAACFVLPVGDHLDDIFQQVKNCALLHRSGGGTGFDFSDLRPEGDYLERSGGSAAGPLNFMNVFNAATMQVKQSGKRQGANMGILRVDHPDIEKFVSVKTDQHALTNFNISVAITDAFMRAVKADDDFFLVNPSTNKKERKIKAQKLFEIIAYNAHKNADPGVVFIDRINRYNPTRHIGRIRATNPCAEMPLLPYEACNLGSINLAKHVKDGEIDWEKLKSTIHSAVHFLDNMIDVSAYPLQETMEIVHSNRKIGLGVMGFADVLFQLKTPYDGDEGRRIAEKIMQFVNTQAKTASAGIAKERGVFANFKGSIYDTGKKEDRVRNATRTAIPPTGTTSIIANCSSGIEPVYALAYSRPIIGSEKPLVVMNKYLLKELRKRKLTPLMEKVGKSGKISTLKQIPQEMRNVFKTAMDISPSGHVLMQAAFQKYTDNAVSKTVNLPKHCSVQDVADIFMMAYKNGCKGITVYVDKSREGQILNVGKDKKKRCPTCGKA